jgi:putative hydrolase
LIFRLSQAAAKHRVALEINNSSFVHSRKGSEANCREVAAAVRDAGGMVALGQILIPRLRWAISASA